MNAPKPQEFRADSLLTSYQVGSLLQVNPSSVNKWVKDGRIPAFRTPGGHRRIRAGDLVAFLHEHKIPVPPPLAQASKRRLLVVDADPQQLERISEALAPYAAQVELALVGNGVDALVQVGAFAPHLVALDAALPSMDGLEVCRRLKAGAKTQGIRVILTSAEPGPELERTVAEAGGRRLLRRPLEVEALLAELGVAPHAAPPG